MLYTFVVIGGAVAAGCAVGYVLGRSRQRRGRDVPDGDDAQDGNASVKRAAWQDLAVNVVFGGLVGFALVTVGPRMVASIHPPRWHEGVIQAVTAEELNSVVDAANGQPVLVYFYAPWCVPCRAMAPHVDELARNGARVVTVDVSQAAALSKLYSVRSVPVVYIFSRGEITYSGLGYHSLDSLRKLMR